MIVVGGDNLIDLIQTDRSDTAVSFAGARGGSAYNTAFAAGRQGAKVGFISPFSTDTLGQFLKEETDKSGVVALAADVDAPSSLAVVTVNSGQPSYQFYRAGTADRQVSVDSINANFPDDAQLFHIASLALIDGEDADAWADVFAAKQKAGVVTTIDPNVRAMVIQDREPYVARMDRLLASADFIKLSDEDMEYLYPDTSFDDAIDHVMATYAPALLIATRGGNGAVARHATGDQTIAPSPVDPMVDTVGAGDTFMATMLAQLFTAGVSARADLEKLSADQLTTMFNTAARAAAINCTRQGCNPPWADELA